MKKKESLKYYLSTFLLSFVFMSIMCVVAHSKGQYLFTSEFEGSGETFTHFIYKNYTFDTKNYWLDILVVFAFPFVFTGIFFIIDFLSKKLKSKKKREAEVYEQGYSQFVDTVSSLLNTTHKFSVEDFRHFRENKKFQEVLKRLYEIYRFGETEQNSYFLCLRKFDKNTKEREAVEYLVTFTTKLINEKGSNNE